MIRIDGVEINPISCSITYRLNDVWQLDLESPLDDRSDLIQTNAVISVSSLYGEQQFRILQTVRDNRKVTATALPIFFDAQSVFIKDTRPTNKNGQEALNILLDGTGFTGSSNIQDLNTAYYIRKNIIECISSDDENAFLRRWGGEVVYNNKEIIINSRIGSDNGARVESGFNLTAIQESIDTSNVVTRILPVGFDGIALDHFVDSPNIDKYPIIYTKVIEYSDVRLATDDYPDGLSLDDFEATLETLAQQEFANGADLPVTTYSVDMVDLSKMEEYKNFTDLVSVKLGDTVHIKHKRLKLNIEARVVAIEYDCIRKSITNLTIGNFADNFFSDSNDISSAINKVINTENNTVKAETIDGIIDGLKTQFKTQVEAGESQGVRSMLFVDNDPSSPTYGAMSIGTMGFQIANSKLPNGEWDWRTFGTGEGFTADEITSGSINTQLIEGWDQLLLKVESNSTDIDDLSSSISSLNNSLKSIVTDYGVSSSNTIQPTSWAPEYPELEEGQWVWVRNTYTYNNGTVTYTYTPLTQENSADQKSITSITEQWTTTTDDTPPTGGWQDSQPDWLSSSYIWQREYIQYSDGTSEYSTPRLIKGGQTVVASTTEPTDTSVLWYNLTDNNIYYYNNDVWTIVNDPSQDIQDAYFQITTEYEQAISLVQGQIEQTVSEIQTIVNEDTQTIEQLQTQITQNSSDVQIAINQVQEVTDALTGKVDQSTLSNYFTFAPDGLTVTTSNSEFSLQVNNNEIGFYQGSNKVAWINNNELHITNAFITQEVRVGEDDDYMAFRYEGDNGWSFM